MNIAAATLDRRTIACLGCLLMLIGGWIQLPEARPLRGPGAVDPRGGHREPHPGALPTDELDDSAPN
jgi:hypothetical protein